MRRRTALMLVLPTCALLITSCKSSSKAKVTTLPAKVSAAVTAAATTAPAPATSASSTPTPIPPPPPATSPPASQSPTPTASASPSASGSPTTLDPCQLVTQSEASTLAGASFGPGREESTGGGKECVYGYQTTNVMDIIVAQAPDAATAQAAYAQGKADVQSTIATNLPAGVTVKLNTANTAGIGDQAATITGAGSIQGQTISFTGIYVLSGATFFTIGDLVLAKAPPTVAAIQDQAKVTLGRT